MSSQASTSSPLSACVNWDAATGKLTIEHLGKTVFTGTVSATGATKDQVKATWSETSEPAKSLYLGYPHGPEYAGGVPEGLKAETLIVTLSSSDPKLDVVVDGVINSRDAIACIPDGGPEMVRSSVGMSRSLLNTGVYDRDGDWALSASESAKCTVKCIKSDGKESKFDFKASGHEVKLVFKPDFYRIHRGYFYWKPTKKLWKEPVAGWCSWTAFWRNMTEEKILGISDFMCRELKDYGYNIVQLDDGFQTFNQDDPKPLGPGETPADYWTRWKSDKFPHGGKWMADQIAAKGLVPGIWLSSALELGLKDDWYVKSADGNAYCGNWISYTVNGMNKDAVDVSYSSTIRGLKRQGWEYFKVDTIRHLIYDSYRQVPEYWQKRGENMEVAFRNIYQGIANEVGPSTYLLACWGVIPELAGLVDGCRIGDDAGNNWDSALKASRYTGQFNYLNNIIWLNDPDYMCFTLPVEQCRTWTSFIALTGMQIMVSDAPEVYDEPRLDILRKVGPPLYIRPTTLRSTKPYSELWLLEVDALSEPWTVLGRIAWEKDLPSRQITFKELGLDTDREYLVFDFWNEKLIGKFSEAFPSDKLPQDECRIYGIRPSLGRPQVLSTNRHIGQGAYELDGLKWSNNALSGKMKLPPGRAFNLFIYVPDGYKLVSSSPGSADAESAASVLKLTLSSEKGGWIDWSARFENSK
jgi:alpha-galactosidase